MEVERSGASALEAARCPTPGVKNGPPPGRRPRVPGVGVVALVPGHDTPVLSPNIARRYAGVALFKAIR